MKEKLKIAGYAQRGVVPLALGVAVTMWLWNALIPEIVGWKAINHGQSLGLLVLLNSALVLKETLPLDKRMAWQPAEFARTYARIARDGAFLRPALALMMALIGAKLVL